MRFIDRQEEMLRLADLASGGGLAVLWGRRRVGKTRLLLEWCAEHDGLYTVADQSAAAIQRRYLATAVATRFPGFDQVDYPDWRSLLQRISREAALVGWRGPIVFDELPYLVLNSPELPSVLQAWVDHDVQDSGLIVAVAGSCQRMMQGLVMDSAEPLYGRAKELLHLRPLRAGYLGGALQLKPSNDVVLAYAAWGGIPRYWQLAAESRLGLDDAIDHLVLNPIGPLHNEPERLLLEELPPAVSLRPVLDAIGLGANRMSEIAGRIGQPATSLTRPLQRLQELELVRREVPFGIPAKSGKRSLYRIADPFFRLWFRVVAPNRGVLAEAPSRARRQLWRAAKPGLAAMAWEDLCRQWVTQSASARSPLPVTDGWEPAGRFWHGGGPEWDIMSRSLDGQYLLLGEAKWSETPMKPGQLRKFARSLRAKGTPPGRQFGGMAITYALFAPEIAEGVPSEIDGVSIVTASQVLKALR